LIAERLAEARARTMLLIEPLTEEQLNTVYSPILSPLAWDLGHIGNFEELWLVQAIGGRAPLNGALGRLYDAIENPRSVRNELPLLRGDELRSYIAEVRARSLEVLERVELDDSDNPLLRDGFAYEMLIAHEHQHNETMLQLLQMIDGYPRPGYEPGRPAVAESARAMLAVPGGAHLVGAAAGGCFAYDNERPRYEVELEPFRIDRTPVSNGEFAEFIADTGAEAPLYWQADGSDGWLDTRFGLRDPIEPSLPVIHVDYEGAASFARWAGKRLPSELEWEVAAAGAEPAAGNLDGLLYGCSLPGINCGSDCGALQMLGDVWEWTDSAFDAYDGFEAFPYPEYSEEFFAQGYRVLRGGSWATRRNVIRVSFRNWDCADRRQIFSGFRCAADG